MSIGSTAAYEGFSRLVQYAEKSFEAKGVGLSQIWGKFEELEDQFVTIAGKKAGEKASPLEKFASQLIMTIDWLVQKTGLRDAFHAIENATKAVNDAVNDTIDKVKGNGEKDVDGFLTRIGKEIKEFFMGPEKKTVENTEKKLEKAVDEKLSKPAEKTEKPADLEKPANDKPAAEKLEDSKGKHYSKTTSDGLIKQEVNVNGNVGGNVNVTQNQYLGQQQHTSSWFDPAKKAENDKFFNQMRDDIVDHQKAASIAEAKKNPVTPESHIQLSEN